MQAVTVTKTEGAKMRGKPTTTGMVALKLHQTIMLPVPGWCRLTDRGRCYSNHVMLGGIGRISSEIGRSVGGSIATSYLL